MATLPGRWAIWKSATEYMYWWFNDMPTTTFFGCEGHVEFWGLDLLETSVYSNWSSEVVLTWSWLHLDSQSKWDKEDILSGMNGNSRSLCNKALIQLERILLIYKHRLVLVWIRKCTLFCCGFKAVSVVRPSCSSRCGTSSLMTD